MKKVRHVFEQGIYIIEGQCCANTHFIENREEAKIFLQQADKRLTHYMEVLEYNLMPTGWQILVRVRSKSRILKYHQSKTERRERTSKKVLTTVSQIISEEIRLLRSRFTNITNPRRGRVGNASKRVYQKYLFESVEEARRFIQDTREGRVIIDQQNSRYQANTSHYDEDGQLAASREILTSKAYQEQRSTTSDNAIISLRLYDYLSDELEKWIKITCRWHGVEYCSGKEVAFWKKC